MPVKIRLMRIGAKKRPFYRVVAVDERKKRTGEYLELLGTYNPLTEPKDIILKQDRIDHWMKNGAVPSDGFLRIIGKAPQKPPRKPKKEQAPKAEPAPTKEEASTEEAAPVDETAEVAESTTPAETQPESPATEEATAEAPAEVETPETDPESAPEIPAETETPTEPEVTETSEPDEVK